MVLSVRRAIRKFPRAEPGSLKYQMVNAAESIAFNIVEGCGSRSPKEFARFLDMSINSSSELEYQIELATDCGFLARPMWKSLTTETLGVRRMLCGLRRRVLESEDQ